MNRLSEFLIRLREFLAQFRLGSVSRRGRRVGARQVSAEMGEITNVMEYQAIAKQKLPKMAYDYYASGAEDEWTLQENREAFSRIL
jgi:hypothetical protein